MPSLITSIIGGVQGANAAHDAAGAISQTAGQVAGNINQATGQAIGYGQRAQDQSNAYINQLLQNAGGAVGGAVGNAGDWVNRGLQTASGALAPYAGAGQGALSTLSGMLAPGGSLVTTPDANTLMAQDPGYQWRLAQGQKALESSAAVRGGALGGAAVKEALRYGQGFASNEYQNTWNRFMQNRAQQYGMLSGLAGMGESAGGALANTAMTGAGLMTHANMTGAGLLNSAGIAGANLGTNAALRSNEYMGNIGLAGTEAAGNILMQGAGAQAAGDIGAANAWSGMLGGIGNAANSFLTGGFGGGGGFNWGGAWSGIPQWGTGGNNGGWMTYPPQGPPAPDYYGWGGGI